MATLNIRGFGQPAPTGASRKWWEVNQVVRRANIAVLADQETHLTESRIEALNRVFAASLRVVGSPDPINQTGARGVAFALNLRMLENPDFTYCDLIPGRAILLNLTRRNCDAPLKILNVYAPNDVRENEAFWAELQAKWQESPELRPDIMLGDFNLVVNPMDRLPMHGDDRAATEALMALLRGGRLVDGWRTENPTDRDFSYSQMSVMSQSRIDRIYVKRNLESRTSRWDIKDPGIHTDHHMPVMAIANYRTPHIGRGRWSLPKALLTDETFMEEAKTLGMALLRNLTTVDETEVENGEIQRMYWNFKKQLVKAARTRAKQMIPKMERDIRRMKEDLKSALNQQDVSTNAQAQRHVLYLQNSIARLEIKRFGKIRTQVAAHDWLEGETISKYWTRLNAPPKPDKVIFEVEEPPRENQPRAYANRSDRMAEIAKEFYNSLQDDPEKDEPERQRATEEALAGVTAHLNDWEKEMLGEHLTREDVETALQEAATGKSPGLDGIPAELWKELHKRQKADQKKERPAFDVIHALKIVFNDIERRGVLPGTDFNKGWICPIYKKKDKRQIENYRPITLLNADYKILTRIIASKLAMVAPSLIHPDQAGFIPGRQIFHHIKLTKLLIDQAEAEDLDGCIVALDQEKAYDKVNHDYLWEVLKHMGFPESFIRTIQGLYDGAESVVIVNGESSGAFLIIRGVRQGDPMSCLLFNLAIEPLACALRNSALKGIKLPGLQERIIAMLFADDTTVYLNKEDDFGTLMDILRRWCDASRAKFNEEKTEVIPIGARTYRDEVVRTRCTGQNGFPLPDGIKIAPQGAATRILGAWVGNGMDPMMPWVRIVDSIKNSLERWNKRNPTLHARRHIVNMEVGGRTQFLARAQTMPEEVEDQLQKMVKEFVWNGEKHPLVSEETLRRKITEGGIGLLDLRARNEALDLLWAKEYLIMGPGRPKWAAVADALLAKAVAATSRNVDSIARVNTFLQTWEVSTRGAAGLPPDLRRMVQAARKYEVRMESNNPARELRNSLPIWYHLGLKAERYIANSVSGRCLRENHLVTTVLDCLTVATRRNNRPEHEDNAKCDCIECFTDRTV